MTRVREAPLVYVVIFTLLYTAVCSVAAAPETHDFLADDFRDARVMPVNLGRFPHQCVGNVAACADGFTLTFWARPGPGDPRLPEQYLISSGGQSLMSQGYYVRRQYGKEYVVGVSVGGTAYSVEVYLQDGARASLTATWSPDHGLKVYVDGYPAGEDAAGSPRLYTSPPIDPFPDIMVGKANDDVSTDTDYPDLSIDHVTHVAAVLSMSEINNMIDPEGTAYELGCSGGLPTGVSQATNPEEAVDVVTCRRNCIGMHKQDSVAFLSAVSQSCVCVNLAIFETFKSSGSLRSTCDSSTPWKVLAATHQLWSVQYPLNLQVTVVPPTSHPYIRPGETVCFQLSTEADERVDFSLDFRNGETYSTLDHEVCYAWSKEGTYNVQVTATTRTTEETTFAEVKIEYVDEGKPPAVVDVKCDQTEQSQSVRAFLTALGQEPKKCDVSFGDGHTENYEEEDLIFKTVTEHTYETIGFYGVKVDCSNDYGQTSDSEDVVVVHNQLEYEYKSRYLDIAIPVIGADVQSNNLLVLINDRQTTQGAKVSKSDVTISEAVFSYSGEHLIQLRGNGQTMYTKVFNLQKPISNVDISANVIHTEVDEPIELQFRIGAGDMFHVWISYGDGEEEFLYYPSPSTPVSISRNYSYAELGQYEVEIIVANEVSSQRVTQLISIERVLEACQMRGTNSTELGTPTVFTFEVDMHMTPAMPVVVTIDYGDGHSEAVPLGAIGSEPMLLTHTYTYNTFGMYKVRASIGNNISHVDVSTLVQVGENITYVDIFTDKERVEPFEDIVFTFHVPRGNPIQLDIEFGDGQTMTIRRPMLIDQYLDGVIPSTTTTTTSSPIVEIEGSGEFLESSSNITEDVLTRRRRRSVEVVDMGVEGSGEAEPEDDQPAPTLPPREDFVVRYNYSVAGTYIVRARVSNQFGGNDAFLCPGVVVVSMDAKMPDCTVFTPQLLNASTPDEPLTIMRSQRLIIAADLTMTCDPITGTTLTPRFTWSAQKKSVYGEWRPELGVCQVENPAPSLNLPSHTLWYGTYKVMMKASLREKASRARRAVDLLGVVSIEDSAMYDYAQGGEEKFNPTLNLDTSKATLYQSLPIVSYVKVVPTPLVAKIKRQDEGLLDIERWREVTVDMTASHDPDVAAGKNNKTGMLFHIFCYQGKQEKEFATKSLQDMLLTSEKIANNTVDTTRFYDINCLEDYETIWVLGQDLVMPGDHLTSNDTVIFDAFVTKDERVARTKLNIKIWATNITVDNALNRIDDLLASGDTSAALMAIDMLTDGLSSAGGDNDTDAKAARAEMRGRLIGALGNCADQLKNPDQLGKTAGALNKITAATDEVTEDSKATAAGALGSAAGKAEGLTEEAPLDQVTGMTGDMVGCAGNVLPFAEEDDSAIVQDTDAAATNIASGESTGAGGTGGSGSDAETAESGASRRKRRSASDSGSGSAGSPIPGSTTHPALIPTTRPPGEAAPDEEEEEEEEEIPCCIRESGLCEWVEPTCQAIDADDRKNGVWDELICDEIHPDDIAIYRERYLEYKRALKLLKYQKRKTTTQGGMGAVNSMGSVIGKKNKGGPEVNIDTPKMKMKLATLDPNANNSLGAFKVPQSAMSSDGGGAAVLESPNPFTYTDSASSVKGKVMSMKMTNADGSPKNVSNLTEPIALRLAGKPDLVPPPKNFHILTSASGQGGVKMNYHAIPISTNNTGLHVIIRPESPYDVYYVYLKYLDFPNETHYDYMATVPSDEEFETTDEWTLEQLRYTFFAPDNYTALNGTYRIGVQLKETKMTLENLNKENNFTYSFRVFLSGCRFFDEEADEWKSDGCEISRETTIRETVCMCNHLTSFGSDFVVPPNTIDFSTVFSLEKFLESMPVFCTVIVIIVLYLACLVWCRIQDKKDLIKWGATPLEDNLPTDNYHYQVTVNTGLKKHSQTESRVQFILSGDDGDTGVRRLFDGKRRLLPAGSIYNYLLSTEHCLGPLTYLRIWHDNSGKGKNKGWFLDQIMLTDIQTGEKFIFLCNRWLAVEYDDGMVERVLPVAGLADLTAFNQLFGASVRKKLTNDHLWFSVMSRPTKSAFTRVQRVSCCVSLLFLTMITNCMFFKTEEKQENVSTLQVGPFSFTLHQLFISVVTTLIVFPPSMAIVTIFRKARPKKNTVMQMNQQLSQKSKKFRWRKFNGGSSLWNNVERSRLDKFKDSMRNIMSFHAKAKYETDGEEIKKAGKKKKKGWTLPWWTIYIAWTLQFFSVVAPGFFTILYSMEWGHTKSVEWLQTFLLSFFQSCFVVQPVKVLLLAAFISCVLRKPELDEEEETFDDANASGASADADLSSSQRDLQEIIKSRKLKASDIPPPDTEALEAARENRMKEMQMEAILKECIVYFFFILVLFFLSYQVRDADSYIFAENLKNTFVRGSPRFDSIKGPAQLWKYTFNAFLPNLYTDKWYNGRDINWREALQIDDRNTIRVGVARMRQLRIKDDTCTIEPTFESMINHCRNDYSWTDDDTKDYDPGWKLPDPVERNETSDWSQDAMYCKLIGERNAALNGEKHSPWIYRNSVELKNGPYAGTLAMYKGGGYTFTYRRSRKKTERLLKILENLEWVDPNTRAMFFEFTVYNANVNLFGSVIMVVEWMAAGSALTRAEVKVFRLSSYVGGFGIVVIFFEVCYLVFTLYFFGRMISLLRKQKLKYFKDFWNMLEFATLIMSIVAIAMYAMKKIFGEVAMNALEESGSGDYVNFVTISIWDETFSFILACVVFVSTVKFIKMLKFNRRMGMLGDTIRLATKDLKNFMIVFVIYFMAFAMAGYLLFGTMLENYGNFIGTLEALFAFALGSFDFDAFQRAQPFLGPAFFFLYVFIVFIGLMSMLITIINDSLAVVKENVCMRGNEYEVVDFMMRKFKGVFGWS